MKAFEIITSSGGAQGENLMEEYGYGFDGSDLSNTRNMEDSVSNVLGDDEYSNFRLFGIGKPSAKQVARKENKREKKASRRGGTATASAESISKAAKEAAEQLTGNSPDGASASITDAPVTSNDNPNIPQSTDVDGKILGMSKPVFFGLVGVAALVVGFIVYKKIKS